MRSLRRGACMVRHTKVGGVEHRQEGGQEKEHLCSGRMLQANGAAPQQGRKRYF